MTWVKVGAGKVFGTAYGWWLVGWVIWVMA